MKGQAFKNGRCQMNRFEKLRTTRLGKAGEELAQKYFTAKGFHCYQPRKGKKHPFDMILLDKEFNQIFAEIKTYPKRYAYNDTGVDTADWRSYVKLAAKGIAPVWLVFIDIQLQSMYYFEVNDELISVAKENAGKTYFLLNLSKYLLPEIGPDSMAKLKAAAAYTPNGSRVTDKKMEELPTLVYNRNWTESEF